MLIKKLLDIYVGYYYNCAMLSMGETKFSSSFLLETGRCGFTPNFFRTVHTNTLTFICFLVLPSRLVSGVMEMPDTLYKGVR